MFNVNTVFSSFSVNDLGIAKEFYTNTLGLKLVDESMGLTLELPGGGSMFVYSKDNHTPASFTILNFAANNIDESVDELVKRGVKFEHYDEGIKTDEKGIARGISSQMGPDIAWFKDPAGNIVSVLQLS